MSATAKAPAPVPQPGMPAHLATGVPVPKPQAAGKQLSLDEDVPSLLNRLQVLAVAGCLLFAVATGALLALSWHANGQAADNTEQLVRVQGIQTSLLRADALATNAFLVGGITPPEQQAAYNDAIDDVTAQIADAARAQPADKNALAALNQAVNEYTTASTQARDNNRQGFPIASEYLREASSGLRADALPIVGNLVKANKGRAEDSLGAQHTWWVLLPGVVALVVLWLVNRELRRRFRRTYNGGVFLAFVLIGVVTFVSVFTVHHRNNANDDLRSGSFQRAVDEASARTAGNDAKSDESQDLIAQGGTTQFSDAFDAASQQVLADASTETQNLWNAYLFQHKQITDAASEGKYDDAVTLATSDADGDPTKTFDAFDARSVTVTQQAADDTTSQLRSGNAFTLFLAILSVAVGLGGAGSCVRGIAARRREYS